MKKKWIARGITVLSLFGLCTLGRMREPPIAAVSRIRTMSRNSNDVKNGNGASPTAGQSHVNNYKDQEEQVNLDASSGTGQGAAHRPKVRDE